MGSSTLQALGRVAVAVFGRFVAEFNMGLYVANWSQLSGSVTFAAGADVAVYRADVRVFRPL